MKAPKWDAGFPEHSVHGKLMQVDFIRRATRGLKQRRVALDIGAHIGLTALALADSFARVHAFEPVRENYDCLVENAMLSDRIRTYNVGLFDSEMFGTFRLPEGESNSGCWHLYSTTGDGTKTQLRTLDSYEFDHVDFIKIDVEGAEGFVLEGAHDTIKRCQPRISIEVNGLGSRYYGGEWVDPSMVLTEFGYRRHMKLNKDEIWRPN